MELTAKLGRKTKLDNYQKVSGKTTATVDAKKRYWESIIIGAFDLVREVRKASPEEAIRERHEG